MFVCGRANLRTLAETGLPDEQHDTLWRSETDLQQLRKKLGGREAEARSQAAPDVGELLVGQFISVDAGAPPHLSALQGLHRKQLSDPLLYFIFVDFTFEVTRQLSFTIIDVDGWKQAGSVLDCRETLVRDAFGETQVCYRDVESVEDRFGLRKLGFAFHVDRNDFEPLVHVLLMQLHLMRESLDASRSPCGPHVEQYNLAFLRVHLCCELISTN